MELLDLGTVNRNEVSGTGGCRRARNRGLSARIFRPALVSPSITGGGNNFDIAVRLVAFMVNHGIGVDTLNQVSFVPADIVANNVVAESLPLPVPRIRTYHVVRGMIIRTWTGYYRADYQSNWPANSKVSAFPISFPS